MKILVVSVMGAVYFAQQTVMFKLKTVSSKTTSRKEEREVMAKYFMQKTAMVWEGGYTVGAAVL